MEYSIKDHEGYKVILLSGALTMFDIQELRKEALGYIADGHGVAIDLEKTEVIDSAGIGMMIKLNEALKEHGNRLVLLQPSQKIHSLLLMSKTNRTFKIVEGYEDLN